jgi:hypothetical protein
MIFESIINPFPAAFAYPNNVSVTHGEPGGYEATESSCFNPNSSNDFSNSSVRSGVVHV